MNQRTLLAAIATLILFVPGTRPARADLEWLDGCDLCTIPQIPAQGQGVVTFQFDASAAPNVRIKIKNTIPIILEQSGLTGHQNLPAAGTNQYHKLDLTDIAGQLRVLGTLTAHGPDLRFSNTALVHTGRYDSGISQTKPNIAVQRMGGESTYVTVYWRGLSIPFHLRTSGYASTDVEYCVEPQPTQYAAHHSISFRYRPDNTTVNDPALALEIRTTRDPIFLGHTTFAGAYRRIELDASLVPNYELRLSGFNHVVRGKLTRLSDGAVLFDDTLHSFVGGNPLRVVAYPAGKRATFLVIEYLGRTVQFELGGGPAALQQE